MINRQLIRIKVVQVSYSYYQKGGNKLDLAEQELLTSLSKAYDLYNYLLLLMVGIQRIAERTYETALSRYNRLHEGECPNPKFVNNLFIGQLACNRQLREFSNDQDLWQDDEDFVRRLFAEITGSEVYQEYMNAEADGGYEADRELWRRLYKQVLMKSDELDSVLEEKDLYWNDDRFVIDTFVLKTINRFELKNGASQELMPEFRDDEDLEFAKRLLRASLLGAESYHALVSQFQRNWELNRMAFMDVLIMQTALAEMFTFPNIPISVTINEYVDIAKMYSTPQSGRYVNGLLDAIAHHLVHTGKLQKEMNSPSHPQAPAEY